MCRNQRARFDAGLVCWLAALFVVVSGCAPFGQTPADPARITYATLEPFSDRAELNDWLERVGRLDPVADPAGTRSGHRPVTQTVSVARHQGPGVEGGDIVKGAGRHLVVLSEGRLASIDTGAGPDALMLIDRASVYRHADSDVWYDELLLHDGVIAVTGYNYDERATELALFQLEDDGALQRLATYYLRADDELSGANHAGRLIDGRLVLYLSKRLLAGDRGPAAHPFPAIAEQPPGALRGEWRALPNVTAIQRPVQQTPDPLLHTVLSCPLVYPLRCSARSVVAPAAQQVFVTRDGVYLWAAAPSPLAAAIPRRCDDGVMPAAQSGATLYRLPWATERPAAVFTAGTPIDQFSFNSRNGGLDVLVRPHDDACAPAGETPLQLIRVEADDFSHMPRDLSPERYVALPGIGVEHFTSRFSGSHLLYANVPFGPRNAAGHWSERDNRSALIVAPLAGGEPVRFDAAFAVQRLERLGDDFLLVGDRDGRDLHVARVVPAPIPQLADTVSVPNRVEAARRSHAFEELQLGAGRLFGLPVAEVAPGYDGRLEVDGRADTAYFLASNSGALGSAGLLAADRATEPATECHVSCMDWYGSAGPIFFRQRVFALAGLEIIEAEFRNGAVRERARLRLDGRPLRGD